MSRRGHYERNVGGAGRNAGGGIHSFRDEPEFIQRVQECRRGATSGNSGFKDIVNPDNIHAWIPAARLAERGWEWLNSNAQRVYGKEFKDLPFFEKEMIVNYWFD